jgi:hypothetical protein
MNLYEVVAACQGREVVGQVMHLNGHSSLHISDGWALEGIEVKAAIT